LSLIIYISLILQNIINYLKLALTRYVCMLDRSNTTFYVKRKINRDSDQTTV